ncbi:Phosphohistidine phosphatase SixA [Actinokineospora spheciospongiae]|uniref:Phosphohistidine phosphatase SixA n=2 Tax=Actinokineospora spheciospongiae TaxID=909613 RepID=W7IJW1_9PSEU|nr:Phosphohistidine phosphatase SixA [Actinokineospora spheciospongiae]PWW53684.1 phosphohistidine phosphatase [Actinokineospora spheciospongiae]
MAPMRRLVVLRHAKSAWPEGVPDYRRPLADRGRRDAAAVGRWLAAKVGPVDVTLVSPATRTRQTWDIVAAELDGAPTVVHDEQLYGEGPDSILAVLGTLPQSAETVLLIGHNPDLEDVVATLSGTRPVLKTATLSLLTWDGDRFDLTPGAAELTTTEKVRGD